MSDELDSKSLEKELEKEFKNIKLTNNNTIDVYFQILSTLANNKKEQQRFMSIIDATCLDYLNKNTDIVIDETKFNRAPIDKMLDDYALKELNLLTNELKTSICDIIKVHGVDQFEEWLQWTYCPASPIDDPIVSEQYDNIIGLLKKIGSLIQDNKLIKLRWEQPYIRISDGKVILRYSEDELVELSDEFSEIEGGWRAVITSFVIPNSKI